MVIFWIFVVGFFAIFGYYLWRLADVMLDHRIVLLKIMIELQELNRDILNNLDKKINNDNNLGDNGLQ